MITFEDWCSSVHVYEQDNLKACWDAAIASEREACAVVCDDLYHSLDYEMERVIYRYDCSNAIRARSNEEK